MFLLICHLFLVVCMFIMVLSVSCSVFIMVFICHLFLAPIVSILKKWFYPFLVLYIFISHLFLHCTYCMFIIGLPIMFLVLFIMVLIVICFLHQVCVYYGIYLLSVSCLFFNYVIVCLIKINGITTIVFLFMKQKGYIYIN